MRATPDPAARHPARPPLALLLVLAVPAGLAVAGCGDAAPDVTPVTVTVTAAPSPASPASSVGSTGSAAAAAPSASAAPSAEASPEPSVDLAALPRLERGYDVALVEGTSSAGGGTVLSIDRLTVAGLDDAVLASEGTDVYVDEGDRFSNQTVRFYEVGVSPEARFFLTTCERDGSGQPAISSSPVDLAQFLAAPGLDGTAVTLVYEDGLVVRGETNPRC